MNPYPQQNYISPWTIAGQAFQQGSKAIGDFQAAQDADEERKNRLAVLMQDLADKKAAAELAKVNAERQAREDANKIAFQKAVGGVVSPTLAADPSLSKASPIVPGGPTQAELNDLSNVQGLNLPNQKVSALDSTAMMGAALDKIPTDGSNGRIEPTPEEILRAGLQYGQMDQAKAYTEGIKNLRAKPADPFNDPELLADYKAKSLDPTFQKLAEGYAKNPIKFGPALQNWATRNGYAGQKWWNTELDNMAHQSPYMLSQKNDLTNDEKDYWAQQYADGKVDPQTLSGMFSSRGGNKAQVMAEIIKRAQALNPGVAIAEDIGGFNASKDKTNRRMLSTIDNVKSRMNRLAELSNSVDRTRFPTLNDWLISGERGAGGMAAELLALNESLMGEELSPVFGQGQAASDAKLHLAQEVSGIKRLPVDVAAAKLKELGDALDARKASITKTFGRYGNPGSAKGGKKTADDYLKAHGL